jgi:hypothetical protein
MENLDFSTVTRRESSDPSVPVRVVFVYPDGSRDEETREFARGLTVGFLKIQIEKSRGFSYDSHDLWLHDQLLADPLSLVDVPAIRAGIDGKEVVVIEVRKAEPRADDDDDEGGSGSGSSAAGGNTNIVEEDDFKEGDADDDFKEGDVDDEYEDDFVDDEDDFE